jgi:CubicO group peptidase (beta-lactamase class C family)
VTAAKARPGAAVTSFMRRARHPLGVAVIEDFGTAWSQVTGGPQDLMFQAGSVSKPVTALAALELAARGEVGLDRPVNERLRSWRVPGDCEVSLRDLLGHTAGTGVSFFPGYARGAEIPTLLQSLDGLPPAATRPVRVDPAVRGTFRYSGGAYAVVQQLIIDVTGLSFAQAADALVLAPLGMTGSTFEQPPPARTWPAAARADWHVYPEAAAAGLWTTPRDLARFVCALQAARAGRDSPVRAEAAAQLLTPHAALPARGEWSILPLLGMQPPDACGLGMFLHGTGRFSHIGGASAFFCVVTAAAADGSGAVVMSAANAGPYPFRLLRAISREQDWTGFRQSGWRRLLGLPGITRQP